MIGIVINNLDDFRLKIIYNYVLYKGPKRKLLDRQDLFLL